MALIGSVTGSVRAQKLDFGSSNAILTASNSGENLIMSSSNLFISSSAYMSGVMTINQPGGVSGITLQSAGGGAALNIVSAQGSAFNSDLYVGNNKTPFPDLWTFSYRGLDNSFLFFSYNGGAFLNSLKLFTNGGVGIGPVAATSTAPGTNVIYTNNAFGIGTGLTAPTARIHIVGGSDSGGAPLRLNSGSLLTSPLSGTIEFNGTNLFVTSGTTRQTILTTLTNNAAVTSSFLVSTASDMTLRVPGAAGETSRSVIVTSNRTPTPTLGGDTFLFISGATSSKGTATRGTAVLAGDVVVSGTLHGGVQFGSSTGLTIQANKVQVTANTLSFEQSGGSDIGFFVSGSIGSRGVANSGGTSLFGGDLYASGVSYFANGLSGSLTRLTDGTSYLVAGANVTITTGSNGAVTIASTGGGGGGTPGGSDTQIQFNDGGSFGGDSDLTFNKTTNVLSATVVDAGNKSVTVTGITGAMVVRGGPDAPGLFGVGSQTVHLVGTGANGSGAGIVFGDYSSTVGVGIFEDTDDTMLVKSSGRMRVQSSGQNVEVQANSYVDVRSSVSYVNIAPATYASISPDAAEIGSNVFFHVSGSSGLQSAPASQGVSVFGGDVVLSGGLYGGYNAFIGNTYLSAQAAKIQIVGASTGNPPAVSAADTFVFVSGSTSSKGTATRGTAVFGGDVVISGTLHGGVQFGSSTGLTVQANKVQVTANTLSFGQSGGSDVGFFVSGSIGSRGVANSGGISVFGGDLYTSGNVYAGTIETTAGGTALYADAAGKLIFNVSDLKMKKDFQPILSPLEKTCALTGTYYFAIEDEPKPENRQIGLIAQNVLSQVPELTVQYRDGALGVRYEKVVALLVEAIKEQQTTIENLKSRIEILEIK